MQQTTSKIAEILWKQNAKVTDNMQLEHIYSS